MEILKDLLASGLLAMVVMIPMLLVFKLIHWIHEEIIERRN